ncbi:DUF4232 domain-containing protein [Rhodococcus opacus]|uniref:DUF4232 domain-containing protein n=1 Tax=Rhodococcus opacus TaxID=37919 RepID=UPI00155AAC30
MPRGGQSSSAAGSIGFPIIFTAARARTCELDGFPRVSYVTGTDGEPVGASAVPEGQWPPAPVRVGVAEPASALVVAVNAQLRRRPLWSGGGNRPARLPAGRRSPPPS